MNVPAPTVPETLLEGWQRIEDREHEPFRAGPISVRAHTVVYEDAERRRRLREAIGPGADTTWRFYFVSRVWLVPRMSTSSILTRIVASNATSAFERELRDRGFRSVKRTGRRTLEVDGRPCRTTLFDAVVPLSDLGADVVARATLAVVPADSEYLLAGGAYPTAVLQGDEANDDDEPNGEGDDAASVLGRYLQPDADREELVRLIRATS